MKKFMKKKLSDLKGRVRGEVGERLNTDSARTSLCRKDPSKEVEKFKNSITREKLPPTSHKDSEY